MEIAASRRKKQTCYDILNRALELDKFFEPTSNGSGRGQVESSYVHGNEPPSFIKCREILDTLGNYYLLKMVNAPRSHLDSNVKGKVIPLQARCGPEGG